MSAILVPSVVSLFSWPFYPSQLQEFYTCFTRHNTEIIRNLSLNSKSGKYWQSKSNCDTACLIWILMDYENSQYIGYHYHPTHQATRLEPQPEAATLGRDMGLWVASLQPRPACSTSAFGHTKEWSLGMSGWHWEPKDPSLHPWLHYKNAVLAMRQHPGILVKTEQLASKLMRFHRFRPHLRSCDM